MRADVAQLRSDLDEVKHLIIQASACHHRPPAIYTQLKGMAVEAVPDVALDNTVTLLTKSVERMSCMLGRIIDRLDN